MDRKTKEVVPRSREARAFRDAEGLSARNLELKSGRSDEVLMGHAKEVELEQEHLLRRYGTPVVESSEGEVESFEGEVEDDFLKMFP